MNKKKNLALLLPCLYGGGAERVASILSQYFYDRGYNIYIFTYFVNRKIDYNFCGKIIKLNRFDNGRSIGESVFPQLLQLRRLVEMSRRMHKLKIKYKIDISISFMEEFNLMNILSQTKDKVFIRVCTILSARKEEVHGQLYLNKTFLKMVYNKANAMILMTDYCKHDMIQNYGIRKEIISIIENPLLPILNNQHLSQNWIYGENVIISVARIEEVKQQQHLIRIFGKITKEIPNARLLLVGLDTSAHARYLKHLTKELKLMDSVIFIGQTNEVNYYLKNSKVFVLTSKTEGFPNSMLEAMALGVPVISVDCPGAPREILAPGTKYTGKLKEVEYVENGILTPALDGEKYNASDRLTKEEEKLKESITELLNSHISKKRYTEIAVNTINKYDIGVIGKKWEILF